MRTGARLWPCSSYLPSQMSSAMRGKLRSKTSYNKTLAAVRGQECPRHTCHRTGLHRTGCLGEDWTV